MPDLSLEGVRVLDFSWVMAGPMATKMLGAMGAEIIKVESTVRPEFSVRGGMFSVINNNKRSCTLNIADAEGQALVRQLIPAVDVVVENFSSRVLAERGLSYEHLRELRPDLIFVSASGLGRTGPQKDLLAYGSLLQGYSGRVGMIGTLNPALEAMGILPAWTDPITALWETLAIMAALAHRDETGEGAYIDLSMLEATVALLPVALLEAALGHPPSEPRSVTEPGAAPSGCFRCAGTDEWLALSVRDDPEWAGLCRAMGARAPFDAADYPSAVDRLRSKERLNAFVAGWLRAEPGREAERRLKRNGVPAARSRHMGELVTDEHLAARGLFPEIDGVVQMAPLPWRSEDGFRGSFSPTPALGADNAYVFGTLLGLNEERQAELKRLGVIR